MWSNEFQKALGGLQMKKKLLCLVLIVGVILSLSLSVSAKKFDDTLGHWAEEAIDEWKEYGIVNGIGNNMFNPNGYMTRAEAAAVFSRLLVLNDRASVESFKDVDLNAWYVESLEKCVSAGILNGDGNNMNPGGYITREMFFTMFCRAFNIQPEVSLNKEFSDVHEISTWAEGYTYALINQGYVNGMTEDTIAPKTNINRASVIALLDRLIVNYAVQDGYVLNSTNTGLSLVVADNCTVADGFSGIVVLSGEDTTISFEGASVDTTIIVKADNIVITDVPENVSVTVAKGIENTEVNGKFVEDDNTFTVTIEKFDDSENDEDDKDDEDKKPTIIIGGHTHNYIGAETIKASCTAEGVMTYKCRCGRSYIETIPKLSETGEHVPAAAVKENEVAGTCLVAGTYDEVVYCSVCGTHEISRTQKTGEFGEHVPGTPVKENEVAGNCQTPATYDEVVYCSVCGTHEISRTQKTGELGNHTPGTPVKENEVAGNCQTPATYDEVVYCSVCGTHEISRTQKTGELGNHTPGTSVKENEVAGNCQIPATYDEVVYCSVCGTNEISRTQKTGELGDHVPGTPVKENEVAGNCQTPATYDEVVYCSVCGTHEISRTQKTGELGDHTPGTPVKENEVAGNCQTPATYDDVIYCSVCGTHEISRIQKTSGYGEHTPSTPVIENEVAGTCTVEGTYEEVVYCSICGTHEISRTHKTSGYSEHIPNTPVKENEVTGTCKVEGTYDEVVYCSVCNTHEISRTQKTTGYGDHKFTGGNCEYCGEAETQDTPEFIVDSVTASAGDTIEIAVSVKNNPGIFDMILSFTYDSTAMTLTKTTNGDVLSDATFMAPKNMASGCRATWYYMDEPHEYANGTVVTLTFDILDTATAGDYTVTVSYSAGDINNYDGDPLSFKITSGTVKIGGSSHAHTPDNAVKENEVLGTCKVKTTYDEVVYCSECGDEISRTQKTGDYGTHKYVSGNCEYCGEAEESDEPQFNVSSITASAGDSVQVVVSLKNNPAIFDMILSFTYDSNAMTLKSVTNGEVMSDATFMAPKNMASGCRATWYYMDEPAEYIDGSVVTLTFDILSTAVAGEYGVSVSYNDGDINNYDEDPLSLVVTDGLVTVE